MYRSETRWLPATAVSAALLALSLAAVGQAPASEISSTQPGPTTIVMPVLQPGPEAVGDSLMAHRRYQAAVEAYKQAPRNSAAVWNKMGIAYQMLFNLQDATRCYEESLKLDPKNANVLNNLGTVYDSTKEFRSAVRMYHKALKIDPKSPLVLKNLGTDLLAQRQYKKGWEAYKEALAIDPEIFDHNNGPRVENPSSVQNRGAMNYYMAKGCVRAGENERAIQYLRMALNEGFTSPKKIAADGEFAALHGLAAFDQLMAEQQKTQ
jgi:tetratricopeptide (TPR) repeat protein